MDVSTERGRFEELLGGQCYDVILADYRLPDFNPGAALELASAASPETPFGDVFATVCEEIKAHMMRGGDVEYVLNQRMALLPRAVQRALGEKAR